MNRLIPTHIHYVCGIDSISRIGTCGNSRVGFCDNSVGDNRIEGRSDRIRDHIKGISN